MPDDRDAVLYAFAIEPSHGRDTLERYLKQHPTLAEELIDLASELRLGEAVAPPPAGAVADPGLEAAWQDFLGCKPQAAQAGEPANPFARFRGAAFVGLAQALNVPRSFLTALRDGLVEPSSVPGPFVRRLAQAMDSGIESVRAHLERPQETPLGLAFKSDGKPEHKGKTTFRDLVRDTPMTDEQRRPLLQDLADDGLA
jgi:hypothetical protein